MHWRPICRSTAAVVPPCQPSKSLGSIREPSVHRALSTSLTCIGWMSWKSLTATSATAYLRMITLGTFEHSRLPSGPSPSLPVIHTNVSFLNALATKFADAARSL